MDQARLAGRALAEAGVVPELVAASDLARARVTAELIAFELEYEKPLVVEPDLREQDLGAVERPDQRMRYPLDWPEQFLARRAGQLGTVRGENRATISSAVRSERCAAWLVAEPKSPSW